jgi:hypothetical protein
MHRPTLPGFCRPLHLRLVHVSGLWACTSGKASLPEAPNFGAAQPGLALSPRGDSKAPGSIAAALNTAPSLVAIAKDRLWGHKPVQPPRLALSEDRVRAA